MSIGYIQGYAHPITAPNEQTSETIKLPNQPGNNNRSNQGNGDGTNIEVVVLDDFEPEDGFNHGEETTAIAEGSSENPGVEVRSEATSLGFQDILEHLKGLNSEQPPPDVLNMSLGFSPASILEGLIIEYKNNNNKLPSGQDLKDLKNQALDIFNEANAQYGPQIRAEIAKLVDKGTTVVISAGNYGYLDELLDTKLEPGFYESLFYNKNSPPGVIVVGASKANTAESGANNDAADFSTPSDCVDVSADGVDVGNNPELDGTSFSAPQIAGLVSDMLAINPNLGPAEIESILKQAAQSTPGEKAKLGAGIVDRDKALDLARASLAPGSEGDGSASAASPRENETQRTINSITISASDFARIHPTSAAGSSHASFAIRGYSETTSFIIAKWFA